MSEIRKNKRQTVIRKLTEKEIEILEYISLHEDESITSVCKKFGADRHTISKIRKLGTTELKDGHYVNSEGLETVKSAVEFYKENDCTLEYIQKEYGFKGDMFKKYLDLFGVEFRDTRLQYNRHVFSEIDTPEKAYWLGFIVADGNIYRKELRLKLAERDEGHLRKFIKFIDGEKDVKILHETGGFGTTVSKLTLASKDIVLDLEKYHVTPKKTGNEKPYLELSEDLIPHYIRGIIDGDGWLITDDDSQRIGCCGSEELMTYIRDTLVEKLGVYKVAVTFDAGSNIHRIVWNGKEDSGSIIKYLFSNTTDLCRLDRKYEKAEKLLSE